MCRQFYCHYQDNCMCDKEKTYRRDKERKEIKHLSVSPN